MKTLNGNLITLAKNGHFDCIVHGCNCLNTWGAGIAFQMKQHFPEAYDVDRHTIKGYKAKLGNYTKHQYPSGLIIINAYTQYRPGPNPLEENYQAITDVFLKIKEKFSGMRIGIPAIGSGLAGGDFDTIYKIIEDVMGDEDVTMVIYKPE